MMTGNENGIMRKAGVLAIVLLVGMLAVGCRKEVMLHSEEEMCQFALSSLEEKYGESFVIDKSYYRYKHKNGHEDAPIILNARIRPESDDNLCAAFYLTEYGSIIDNYSIIRHQYEVEDEILPGLKEQGLEGGLVISCPLTKKKADDDISVDEIIYGNGVTIMFYQTVSKGTDVKTCIPNIRKWMDYLYSLDYEWAFSLVDENDHDYIFYQLNKDDGRSSADEWQDEEILRISKMIIRDSERDLIRDDKADLEEE